MGIERVEKRMLPIGLIGAGSMGSHVARAILRGEAGRTALLAVADPVPPSQNLLEEFRSRSVVFVDSFASLADMPIRLAVECANQEGVRRSAALFLSKGIDLLIMSVGALVQGSLLTDLASIAEAKGCRIHIPSGAIGAIDALRAAKLHGLEEVMLTTRKPPRSLGKIEGVDLTHLEGPRVVYEGNATEAVVRFPQNVNVAATISLAGVGPSETKVRIVADPTINQNVHEIHARGAFGSFDIRLTNVPSPENPKTSLLACLSVIALLRRMQETVQIGS
jgi:aspartate dehydrogenase